MSAAPIATMPPLTMALCALRESTRLTHRAVSGIAAAAEELLRRDRESITPLARNVVLVHDDPGTRRMLAHELRQAVDAQVFTAATVREGVATITAHRPRVVVIDYHLGAETALDLMRRVHAESFSLARGVRYLVVTGRVDIDDLRALMREIQVDARTTPITDAELTSLFDDVRHLLDT